MHRNTFGIALLDVYYRQRVLSDATADCFVFFDFLHEHTYNLHWDRISTIRLYLGGFSHASASNMIWQRRVDTWHDTIEAKKWEFGPAAQNTAMEDKTHSDIYIVYTMASEAAEALQSISDKTLVGRGRSRGPCPRPSNST